ncbi:MAG: GNAT family protein [Parvularculaceae bacterium]
MTDMSNWSWRAAPALKRTRGRYVTVEPAAFPDAAEELFSVLGGASNDDLWTYIPIGPFESAEQLGAVMSHVGAQGGWITHLFRDARDGAPLGMASYMRIRPEAGSAEVGCVVFSKKLQRTPAATEAMYLMARHVFDDLGYRRYEWKCNDANAASKRAAIRLGFTFEGVFRQDMVMKGRNRDTAWFSMIDKEWPAAKAAFEAWLAPENFGADGGQRRSLKDIRDGL